ncbi:MAG TPA: hypothetical protein VGY77_04390 [Gemmataceae bacterium]|nr:hypothetical protein [Gemmataceae bacterium]
MDFVHRWGRYWIVGIMIAFLVTGCGEGGRRKGRRRAHAHPTSGPHDGILLEWGDEEYHVELTIDNAKKEATVYILDDTAKKAEPIEAETITLIVTSEKPPVEIQLKPDPQEDDPKGKASRFTGSHAVLGNEDLKGAISGKVAGKAYKDEFDFEKKK